VSLCVGGDGSVLAISGCQKIWSGVPIIADDPFPGPWPIGRGRLRGGVGEGLGTSCFR